MKKGSEKELGKEIKRVKKERKTEVFVFVLALVSIAGFALSLFFLVGITGAAIGSSKNNLFGLIVIVSSYHIECYSHFTFLEIGFVWQN